MERLQVLPHDIEAEQSILWAVFIDHDILSILLPTLRSDDFYDDKNKIVWKAFKTLDSQNIKIDMLTVREYLEKEKTLDKIWWVVYLAELASSTPTSCNAESYLKIVKNKSLCRNIIKFWELAKAIWYKEIEVKEWLQNISKELMNINTWYIQFKPKTWDDLIKIQDNALKEHKELLKQWKSDILKSYLGISFERWTHAVIWALPSHWKSALLLNFLLDFAKQWYKVLYVNIEMTEKQVMDRIYANLTWIDSTLFKYKSANNIDEYFEQWRKEFTNIKNNFFMLTGWSISSNDIAWVVAKMINEDKIDVHWVDYLWILWDKAQSRVEQMVQISNNIRSIPKNFNTVWLAAAQFSKEWYKVDTPSFAHIKDSSAIYDDADIAIVLKRFKEDMNFNWEHTHDMIIEKNRTWRLWRKKLSFSFWTMRFSLCDENSL